MIKGLIVEVGEQPEIIELDSSLEVLMELAGGYIQEVYPYDDSVVLICNENGKLMHLPKNRYIDEIDDTIHGDFLILGNDGSEDYTSLTDEQITYYTELFKQ